MVCQASELGSWPIEAQSGIKSNAMICTALASKIKVYIFKLHDTTRNNKTPELNSYERRNQIPK